MADQHQSFPELLDGLDDSRRAWLELLGTLRRNLYLYTPLIRPDLYNDAEVLAAIRNRVVSQPRLCFLSGVGPLGRAPDQRPTLA